MGRAYLRLRPDGIPEIVSQHRTRQVAAAALAVLAATAAGVLAAAALAMAAGIAEALAGGTAVAVLGLAGFVVRSRMRSAARPLASTIQLRPVHVPSLAPSAGSARDAGA